MRGTTSLFGINRAFAGSVDLPPATASDIHVGTGFFAGHDVEGREITYRAWEVWE